MEPQSSQDYEVLHSNSSFRLPCLASGKPEIDFKWFFDAGEIAPDDPHFVVAKEHKEGDYDYDVTDGWYGLLGRNVDDVDWSCDNLHMFDGVYQCQAWHGGYESDKSSDLKLTTLCRY